MTIQWDIQNGSYRFHWPGQSVECYIKSLLCSVFMVKRLGKVEVVKINYFSTS